MKRLTTHGRETAEAIRDRVEFTTNGAMHAESMSSAWYSQSGYLEGADEERFRLDAPNIRYIVFSYSTPIAWWTTDATTGDGNWYIVQQRFSITTSRHQGNLYLIPTADHETSVVGKRGDWQVRCDTCDTTGATHYTRKPEAHRAAYGHGENGGLLKCDGLPLDQTTCHSSGGHM